MERGVFQCFPVHQMVGGNPIWWDLNNVGPPSDSSSSSSALPQSSVPLQPMTSWHEVFMGGLVEEEDRCSYTPTLQANSTRMERWEDQVLLYPSATSHMINEEIQARSSWTTQKILPNSSPRSCVTTTSLNSSMLDFSNNKAENIRHHQLDLSPECNSTPTGSPYKKPRVQAQSPFKVRKEKLGDRITALHQIVSPFGKTDTASVLLETIGYIRFLQSQIEALTSPYLGTTGSGGNIKHSADAVNETKNDLKGRGLCLVPISFMMHVGNNNAADYWAPTFGGGFR